ncbi:MAG: molybdate ABC transporter substrate-binding protein [Gammaproteobacteria bacterium]|nr:molybdate ABC transporter substrate-binding protein [Gammaproteobacteria bacterium]
MTFKSFLAASLIALAPLSSVFAGEATIVAASDLKFAMNEIVKSYEQANPNDKLNVIYGSSGKFFTQIQNDAPYDVFFSADVGFPTKLKAEGKAVGEPVMYALGRIVLWSTKYDASTLTLADAATDKIKKFAIASPDHAPYGARAKEALEASGLWEKVQPKIVNGENISHTAQMVESGAADAGIIALSLALSPTVKAKAPNYVLIDDKLHNPLKQAYIVTKRAENNDTAKAFVAYMESPAARKVMDAYGFVLPKK